jgi:hypothetical protein
MEKTKYDVFISYRREGGDKYARTIQQALEKQYRVFLDFDELKDGVFDQRIIDAISESSVFLLILSKGALDRCVNEDDWVRQEILHATKCGCHIVPVTIDDTFEGLPASLPEELRRAVGQHQFSELQMKTLFKASMDQLVRNRIEPYVHREETDIGAEIHIETDADCDLLCFKTFKRHLKTGEDNIIHMDPGKYKFEFVSTLYPEAKFSMVYSLTPDITCDYIEVRLKGEMDKALLKRQAEEKQKRDAQVKTTKSAPQTVNLAKPTPKTTSTQKPSMSLTERARLYRQLGMVKAAEELERQKKDSSKPGWIKFFFDFSKVPYTNYVITYAVLAALIAYHYLSGFYEQHPFGIWDVIISAIFSYVGIRCNVALELCTDDSEEIKNVFWGIIIVPFFVIITPFWSLIFGGIIWCLFDMELHWVDFHEIGVYYLYCTTAFFTFYTLIVTLIKRKGNKS